MSPAPPAARRFSLLPCVLATAVALVLSACGNDGSVAAENANQAPIPSQATTRASLGRPGPACPAKLGAFVDSLERLRRQLAVGLSYEQYAAKIDDLQGRYDAIPIDRLGLDCLATAGTAGERALNKHIDAVNAWGECLADAACTTATIEPVLQRKWRIAARFLAEAE